MSLSLLNLLWPGWMITHMDMSMDDKSFKTWSKFHNEIFFPLFFNVCGLYRHNLSCTLGVSLFFLSWKETDSMPILDCFKHNSPACAPPRVRTSSLLCPNIQRPSLSCAKSNLKIIFHSTSMHCQQAGILACMYNTSAMGDWSGGRGTATVFSK